VAGCIFSLLIALPNSADAATEFKPYGFVLANIAYNSGRVNINDIPTMAINDASLEKSLWMSARQSRIGVKITPDTDVPVKAVIEVDVFKGVRRRTAFAQIKISEKTNLIVGQHWMIFSPVLPTSLAHQGVVTLTASGNLWTRVPQVRIESNSGALSLQAAIQQPISGSSQQGVPDITGRAAYTLPMGTCGVSAYVGMQSYNGGNDDVTSFAVSADWSIAAGPPSIKGEAGMGESVSGFGSSSGTRLNSSGVTEGVPVVLSWVQLGYKLSPKLAVHAGLGMEIPDRLNIEIAGLVDENRTIYANAIWKPWGPFRFALQVDQIETIYLPSTAESALVLNIATQVVF
jgi:hypothetical protein